MMEPGLELDQGQCKQCSKPIRRLVVIEGYIGAAPGISANNPEEPGMKLGGVSFSGRYCSVACATVMLEGWGRQAGREPSDF